MTRTSGIGRGYLSCNPTSRACLPGFFWKVEFFPADWRIRSRIPDRPGRHSDRIHRRITDFIHHEDQDGFYYQKLICQKKEDTEAFEIKMKRSDGVLFDARLQMQLLSPVDDEEPRYSLALLDISEYMQLSVSLSLQRQSLDIVSASVTMSELLPAYVQMIKHHLKCDAVGIRLLDRNGDILYQAQDGFSQTFCHPESSILLNTCPCMCAAVIKGMIDPNDPWFTSKGSFYTNGISRLHATVPIDSLGKMREMCIKHGYESIILVPVTANNKVHGLIHMADRRENVFPLRIVENIESLGARLGIAIHRFDLQEKLSQTVDSLNNLSSHLLTVQENEQRRIAMELHDGCGQDLNAIKLRLKGLQKRMSLDNPELSSEFDQLLQCADKVIDNLRDIAHGLNPAALDVLGLPMAAMQVVREFSANTGIQVEMDLKPLDRVRDSNTKICLFRILQEALTNITKHAQASWVSVVGSLDGENLCICIRDNGLGFDTRKMYETNGTERCMGLSAMRLRCHMIDASFEIDSEKGKGTQLTICVPCC
jgi:signal transduction histidine kinase